MTNPNRSEPSGMPAAEPHEALRVLNIRISADLHRALAIYEAEHGLNHTEVVEAGLRLVLAGGGR